MGSSARRFSGEYLPLYIEQEFAGQAVVEAFGNRHALQNTIDKKIDSFLMKAVCNFTKLGNPVLLPFFYRGNSVLSKALTEQVAKLREMLMNYSIVVPSASLECEKRRRRRLLECLPQLLLGFAGIKGRLPAKPDAPPVGDAENIQRLNRIWFNFSGQEFSERHIQRACNPQIDRKHRQLLAGSPTRHGCGDHSQHSRKTGKALGICRSPDQTRQLLSTQQCGRGKCSTDHVLDLTGSPYLPAIQREEDNSRYLDRRTLRRRATSYSARSIPTDNAGRAAAEAFRSWRRPIEPDSNDP